MNDILLKFKDTDRAGRGIYDVHTNQSCATCGNHHFRFTGQQIRFDLDGNLHIKVDNMITFKTPRDDADA